MNSTNSLVNFVSDPAFALDRNLRLVAWNKGAESLMGYSFSEVTGRTCYDVFRAVLPDGEPLCSPSCEGIDCFRQGTLFSVPSCKIRNKDGQFHTVSLSSMVVPAALKENTEDNAIAIIFFHQNTLPVIPSNPQPLQIFSFGNFGLIAKDSDLNTKKWKRKQALTLLKYLITYRGHAIPRERLMECLWPEVDEHHGRDRLKVTLYYLRNQLREAGIEDEIIETVNHAYLLRGDKIWLDADVFELAIAEGTLLLEQSNCKDAIDKFEQAQHLYRGDYLEQDIYEDWCAEERERQRELYLYMFAKLAQCYAELGFFFKAIQACRSALACEPCREYFHRTLMIYLTQSGQRDQVIMHYKECEQILQRELGVEPMAETQEIYLQILDNKFEESRLIASTLN